MQINWNSYLAFERTIKQEKWYLHDKEIQEFFDILLATVKKRFAVIQQGEQFFRAQLGCDEDPLFGADNEVVGFNAIPYSEERMKPDPQKMTEGRVNSNGIPCLYLSTNDTTAISEVRPWLGSYVTIAQFKMIKDIKIIDCSRGNIDPLNISVSDLDMLFKFQPTTREESISIIWRWIDKAFSEPVDRNEKAIDYVPTQAIAEFFKKNGYGGILYKSLFNNGKNLALFDIDSAVQVDDGKVVQVTNSSIQYRQIYPTQFKRRTTNE